MKLSIKTYFFYFLLGSLISLNSNVFSQTNSKQKGLNIIENTLDDFFAPIKICKWKDDAKTCVNLLFYDNCKSHRKISQILDQYGYKGTFPIIPSYMFEDSLRDISARGHEIANHTFSHLDLYSLTDSAQIDFEIRKAKEMIEDAFGIKCVDFFGPGGSHTALSIRIALNYNLFVRDYSEFPDVKHIYLAVDSKTILQLPDYLNSAMNSGSGLVLEAHGIDGDGYHPISKEELIKSLDLLKTYTQNGVVWVTTAKEGNVYEDLYHELELEKFLNGDTLTINFKNYNSDKYQNFDASPISIEIPYNICNDLKCLTDSAVVKKLTDKFVITTDLMRDTTLVVVLKGFTGLLTDSLETGNPFIIYPNPSKDIINLRNIGDISLVEIYNPEGKLIESMTNKASQIDISQLNAGFYLIKVTTGHNNSNGILWGKFLKI